MSHMEGRTKMGFRKAQGADQKATGQRVELYRRFLQPRDKGENCAISQRKKLGGRKIEREGCG